VNFQTWICPKCYDDHRMDGPCSPMGVDKFSPHPDDSSYLAIEFRKLESRVLELSGELDKWKRLYFETRDDYVRKCDELSNLRAET
jgi:hypothetical protein